MDESNTNVNSEKEDVDSEDTLIQWSDLLFLPFRPNFRKLVLAVVIVKSIMGPIQSVYPIVYCWPTLNLHPVLGVLKFFYIFCCDPIYLTDTFLHILHRQVTDAAVRREFLPKRGFLLLLDIISVVPFFQLMIADACPPVRVWPNILAFTEFTIIYRIVEYFNLVKNHCFFELLIGVILVLIISIHCIACFILLLTYHGLCANCNNGIYDWRQSIIYKITNIDKSLSTYCFAATQVFTWFIGILIDNIQPVTLSEFILASALIMSAYLVYIFVATPKMFAEAVMHQRKRSLFYCKVRRIIEETNRRNPMSKAHIDVRNFFHLMWNRRSGITFVPEIMSQLPRYLRIAIKQDLVWQVFYHSPTLRCTSESFKRLLSESIQIDYKLPGEKFYTGTYSNTNLYYLKSGIVQIISSDDGTTPLISLTSGTIFGDISFILPSDKRNVQVKCLTYCEVLFIKQVDILNCIHKFPDDRRKMLDNVKLRIKHAYTLFTCKQHVKGLDRTEDEGIAWLKRRWWEISDTVYKYKTSNVQINSKSEIPPEEAVYHCAKYIGQLVLCSDEQLQMNSMFSKVKFPWLLVSDSFFQTIWKYILVFTVTIVLVLFPPALVFDLEIKALFSWVDLVYMFDVCISLITVNRRHEGDTHDIAAIIFAHCKTKRFWLDISSTVWIESILYLFGYTQHYYFFKINRLIKIYILLTDCNIKNDPTIDIVYKVLLSIFSFFYIAIFALFYLVIHSTYITTSYLFGYIDVRNVAAVHVLVAFMSELTFQTHSARSLTDTFVGITFGLSVVVLFLYCTTKLVASYFLKYREIISYQQFVSNVKDHYKHHKIHPNLLKRLDRYLVCHWKYYNGVDVMHPNTLKNEPHDIYWKVQGEVAEKTIKQSKLFAFADPTLIRELSYKAKFLILPKSSTVLLFGLPFKTVTWLVNGFISSEYPNESGDVLKEEYKPGDLLSTLSVFFGCVSLRTLSASTECEILYLDIKDFFSTMKRFQKEWCNFEKCVEEFSPALEKIVKDTMKLNEDYQNKIRLQIFHGEKVVEKDVTDSSTQSWITPQSKFVRWWLLFRAALVVVSIASISIQGCHGAVYRWPFMIICSLCDTIAVFDIALKLFLGYYDERGLLITSPLKRICNYISRGFLMDLVGCLPCTSFIELILTKPISQSDALLLTLVSKFAHMYLLTGYLNYIADRPNVPFALIMILKWSLVSVLVLLAICHYLVNLCVDMNWDSLGNLLNITKLHSCWFVDYYDSKITEHQVNKISALSLTLAQDIYMGHSQITISVNEEITVAAILLFICGTIFWIIMCYTLSLLVLNYYHTNTLFQHGVYQLEKFLTAERLEKKLITQTVAHFRYWWLRTKGINIQSLMNHRIGVVFRQDLSYYFFKKTLEPLSSLLGGGETLERELSSACTQLYFLPGEVITREMDLSPWVYVVHRGKIIIKEGDEHIALLSKGSMFGQLDGAVPRPLLVTAVADDHADILQIPIKDFQMIIGDEARNIIRSNSKTNRDYMKVKKIVFENPYNTVQYILRGRKAIKLPWMNAPVKVNSGSWYTRWLYLSWIIGPVVSAIIASAAACFPNRTNTSFMVTLWTLDMVHLLFIASEIFTTSLVVVNGQCVHEILSWRIFRSWGFYCDILSLILPQTSGVPRLARYYVRLLRLRLLYDFNVHFCRGFRSRLAPVVLKYVIVLLTLHLLACSWITFGCNNTEIPLKFPRVTPEINATIDYNEWLLYQQRPEGCTRMGTYFDERGRYIIYGLLVPRKWIADYIIALATVIILFTNSDIYFQPMFWSNKQIYARIFTSFVTYWLGLWLLSVAIGSVYTKLRDLYLYDYNVMNVMHYLERSGLSPVLLKSLREYTEQLWNRQRGNWLPELALQAPQCLREDLLSALYIHHLQMPPLFKSLPSYFTRQLVARFQRIVIFPGKFIVQEGDIFGTMYFIHEGEVEKWYTTKNDEMKMHSLLTTNGYFGLLPGLFPNTPYQFSYYTRTVVDLVYLRYKDWMDLLQGYHDIKQALYEEARNYNRGSAL